MRLFMAMLYTETNTFADIPAGWAAFREGGYSRGEASAAPDTPLGVLLAEWRRLAEADGCTVIEGAAAMAQPAGRTVRPVYEALRDQILEDLRAAGPVDMVLFNLHGSMAAEGYDDCEGDLLAAARAVVGPKAIIGAELDLHCNVSEAMLTSADALVAYKEYPHVDELERGRELYALCRDAALGRVRPRTGVFDCRMISLWRTTEEPMRGFVRRMQALEGRDGVLSVSFGHGFPWSDVADVTSRIWVITDDDQDKADRLARELAEEIYAVREQTRPWSLDVEAALDRALACDGLAVLADVADNPGGGAASDSTFILKACLDRGLRDVAIGCLWDPQAVALCQEAGVGARFNLRVGGKMGPASGSPVDLTVTVRAIQADHAQTGLGDTHTPMGPSAWIEADGIDIVLNSRREQVFSPDAFTSIGVDLASRRIVAVKSTQHFHAAFADIAEAVIYVATPGAIAPDFAAIPYTKRDGVFWPRQPDPLRLGPAA